MGPAPGSWMRWDRMGQDEVGLVGWETLGAALEENPEDPNAERSCPRESTSFLTPWGAGPELSHSVKGQRGRKAGALPWEAPSQGTWDPADTNEV